MVIFYKSKHWIVTILNIFNYVDSCVSVCGYVHMSADTGRGQNRAKDFLKLVIGSYEPPDMANRNWTLTTGPSLQALVTVSCFICSPYSTEGSNKIYFPLAEPRISISTTWADKGAQPLPIRIVARDGPRAADLAQLVDKLPNMHEGLVSVPSTA